MIVDNRITEYLHSLEISRGELLDTIEKKAIEDGVPIIRSETAALLRSLTAALRPPASLVPLPFQGRLFFQQDTVQSVVTM